MKKHNNDVISLNDKLLSEFSVEELESRLETDPLALSALFVGTSDADSEYTLTGCSCKNFEIEAGGCPNLESITIGGKGGGSSSIDVDVSL